MAGDFRKTLLTVVVMALCAALGWLLVRSASENSRSRDEQARNSPPPRVTTTFDRPNPDAKSSRRDVTPPEEANGLPGERIVMFGSDEEYERFLASLDGSNIRLLGRLDKLRALRLGYDDLATLQDLLGDQEAFENYSVYVPLPPERGEGGSGGPGFGNRLFEWLGIPRDNSSYGEGIVVAMIDTGVSPDSPLSNVRQVDLLTESGRQADGFHPHGDTMASILLGDGSVVQGIAPSSQLISLRIGDESGAASSFLLAEAIVRAVDQGADVINISMGSDFESTLVNAAVDYATENSVLIVASAGNNAGTTLSHPAAHESVISVGAVDANANHASFSNQGEGLTLAAPGIDIPALSGSDLVWSTGTSPGAMVVSGLIVATATETGLGVTDAYEVLSSSLNEVGPPGDDPLYGAGYPDFRRVQNTSVSGIYDVAMVNPFYLPASSENPSDLLLFTVENRGTETISGINLEVDSELGLRPYPIGSLGPDEIQTVALNVPSNVDTLTLKASATIPTNFSDSNPTNNTVSGTLRLDSAGEASNAAP